MHGAERTAEVLAWLAGFHGTFQNQLPELPELWAYGTHVHLERRPPGELETLELSLRQLCQAFAGHRKHCFRGVSQVRTTTSGGPRRKRWAAGWRE